MSESLVLLIILAVFGGLCWRMWHKYKILRRQRAELEALAGEKGWRHDRSREGRRTVTSIASGDGRWSLRLVSGYSTGGGSTAGGRSHSRSRRVPGFSELHLHAPTWRGTAIFLQPQSDWVERWTGGSGVMRFLQNTAVKATLITQVPAGVLDDMSRLSAFEAPAGIELSILATDDPRDLDLKAIHDMIHGFSAQHQRGLSPSSVTLGSEGLRIRLSDQLREVEDIASFIDAGEGLAERLKA